MLTAPRTTLPSAELPHPPGHDAAWRLVWLLRVACAAEFVGHGAFGIITKAAWVPGRRA